MRPACSLAGHRRLPGASASGTIRYREGQMSAAVRSDSIDNQALVEVCTVRRIAEDVSGVTCRKARAFRAEGSVSVCRAVGSVVPPARVLRMAAADTESFSPAGGCRPVAYGSGGDGPVNVYRLAGLVGQAVRAGVTRGMTRGFAGGGSIRVQVAVDMELR